MILLEIVELSIIVLILTGMITQVAIPIWNDTLLFPIFRSKSKALEHLRAEAIEEIEQATIESQTLSLKDKAASLRPKTPRAPKPPMEESPPQENVIDQHVKRLSTKNPRKKK